MIPSSMSLSLSTIFWSICLVLYSYTFFWGNFYHMSVEPHFYFLVVTSSQGVIRSNGS